MVAFLISVAAGILFAQPSAAAVVVNGGTLRAGVPVTGKVAVAGQDIQYSFAATKDAHLTFNVTASNWGATGNAYLRFYNPTGGSAGYCDLRPTQRSCDLTPNVTGTWKIKLDPVGDTLGQATIAFYPDQYKGTVTAGVPITTTINAWSQDAHFTFAATKDAHLTFNITASSWDGSGNAYLRFYNPTGGAAGYCDLRLTQRSCDLTPNVTGTWKIKLDPTSDTLGQATFAFYPDQIKGAVTAGVPITTTINAWSQDAHYTFAATKDAHLTFTITATNWEPGNAYLRFYNPTGGAAGYCELRSTQRSCDLTPNVTGTWKIKLDPNGDSVGSTTFAFYPDQNKGAITAGTPITTTINAWSQDAWYTFAATKDVKVVLAITSTGWGTGNAYLRYYNPTGGSAGYCELRSTARTCEITPTVTGTWKIKLDPTGDAVGSMTMVRR